MSRLVFLFIILLVAVRPAAAQDRALPASDEPAFPGQAECHVDLPDGDWTPQERWAWERICLNKRAIISRYEDPTKGIKRYRCSTANANSWPDHSVISEDFFRLILTHPSYQKLIQEDGVRVYCAKFEESIDFQNLRIDRPLSISHSIFERGINMRRLQSTRWISFYKSIFNGQFIGSGIEIEGDMLMKSGEYKEGTLITAAKIGRDFDVSGSLFKESFNASGLKAGGNLFLGNGADFKDLSLIAANINGQLHLNETNVRGTLSADGLKVGDSLLMRNRSKFHNVRLIGTQIGGNLDISSAFFNGHLDATGAQIGHDLLLASSEDPPPKWAKSKSALTLRNVHAGAVQDTEDSWNLSDGALDLNGFTYDRLGGLRSGDSSTMADRDIEWLRDKWLAKQKNRAVAFQPRPYRQLATVLRESGHAHKADRVLFAMRDHQFDHAETSGSQKFWLWASGAFLGYGYEPWKAVGWLFGLVLLGAVFAYLACRHQAGFLKCFFFSLDLAVPLIGLTPPNQNFANNLPDLVDWYFHIHKIAGLILVSVLVASMTGLVG